MRITRVSVTYSQTVQMRQFEPFVMSQYAEAQVDEGDDPKKVLRSLKALVKEQVDDTVKEKKIERKKTLEEQDALEKNN